MGFGIGKAFQLGLEAERILELSQDWLLMHLFIHVFQ
jgi:hypothetical protein